MSDAQSREDEDIASVQVEQVPIEDPPVEESYEDDDFEEENKLSKKETKKSASIPRPSLKQESRRSAMTSKMRASSKQDDEYEENFEKDQDDAYEQDYEENDDSSRSKNKQSMNGLRKI